MVGKTSQEMETLKGKVDQLSKAGLRAELLSRTDLLEVEPALVIDEEGGAAFCPDDYQMDARRSVAYIEKVLVISIWPMLLQMLICLSLVT